MSDEEDSVNYSDEDNAQESNIATRKKSDKKKKAGGLNRQQTKEFN